MTPVKFKESNRTLGKPESMTDEECGSLDVYTDGESCLSCWRMSFLERLRALFFGRVWLWVVFGHGTQPPVALECKRTAFRKERHS